MTRRTPHPPCPTAEDAYADAPPLLGEIAWIADQVTAKPLGQSLPREFTLRKLAVLDRIALHCNDPESHAHTAQEAAQLMDADSDHTHPDAPNTASLGRYPAGHPAWEHWGPLGYLRQEYQAYRRQLADAA